LSIRTVIIGYGMGRYHAEVIPKTPGLELLGICDTDPARLEAAGAEHPGIRSYADTAKVFGDPQVDLVVLATPHDTHCPLAVAGAKAGKHVVTEKVMCLNAREAERMIEAAAKAGTMLSVFQNRRWDGDYLTVRKIMDDGTLGTVFQVESAVVGWGSPGGWRGVRKHCGGGMLDWGAHLVDQANQLAGCPPVTVFADMQSHTWSVDIETHHKVLIRYASGLLADIETSYNAWVEKDRWRVLGERGALTKKGFGDDPVRIRTTVGSFSCSVEVPPVPTTWDAYYRNVADHLKKKAPLAVKPEECLLSMRVFDAAYASAAKGKAVALASG
jgi:scyllo-inositol 2-dehydrogenase (NADP+)